LTSSFPPIDLAAADVEVMAEIVNSPEALAPVEGDAGSGWKSDMPVANSPDTEIHPSMGTYVDPGTGAVTLYAAYIRFDSSIPRYDGWLARSFNQGSLWSEWWHWWWSGVFNITYLSLAVNTNNNTVFIAFESEPAVGNHRIDIFRIDVTTAWQSHPIDTSGDNRIPSLTVEYSWLNNWLFVSYEKWTDTNDRDMYVARSKDWGTTWSTQLLRGGVSDTDVYSFSDTTYAQGVVYIAYMHSTDWFSKRHIDVSVSTDYGVSYTHVENISQVPNDASWPTIAGSRRARNQAIRVSSLLRKLSRPLTHSTGDHLWWPRKSQASSHSSPASQPLVPFWLLQFSC
jgi:hypothetical protein